MKHCISPQLTMFILVEEDPEEEKAKQKQLTEEYKPLLDWLKKETKDIVRDGELSGTSSKTHETDYGDTVVVSNRLVTSPCAIVADAFGYTANMEKLLSEYRSVYDITTATHVCERFATKAGWSKRRSRLREETQAS